MTRYNVVLWALVTTFSVWSIVNHRERVVSAIFLATAGIIAAIALSAP